MKLWRVADGVRLDTLSQPQAEVFAVAFAPDGRHLVAAGRDRRIHVWEVATLDAPGLNPPRVSRYAHESAIVALALSPDGTRLATGADDGTARLWSFPAVDLVAPFAPRADAATVIAPRADGTFLAGTADGIVAALVAAPGEAVAAALPTAAPIAVAAAADLAAVAEAEPNDSPATAPAVPVGVVVSGLIGAPGDVDLVRFSATAGQAVLLETNAARSKSPLDSRIEVLHAAGPRAGEPVERVVLRATRDSWFTFRGKDSSQSDDFRLHNWAEMELDELLYTGGEVVKLWLYPRGPDSGFKVYPGGGPRQTLFDTTAVTHALGEPAWIVEALPAGARPAPNGLPVFRLVYDNDDAANRRLGTDSQLLFTAPADGDYLARVSDVRSFGGPDHRYALSVRAPRPDFTVAIGGMNPKVSPGSAREVAFTVTRDEGFDGAVRIAVADLPPGFTLPGPIEIEAGQERAIGVLAAAADAVAPDEALDKAVRVTATATILCREVAKEL
ncbi:MAG: WD40 repeat domain-containing protein, partial [Planctomycetota bacterium]